MLFVRKNEYDAFMAADGALIKQIIIRSEEIIKERKIGAYKEVLDTKLYCLKLDYKQFLEDGTECRRKMPEVTDKLDKKYHLEVLGSQKYRANRVRSRAERVAHYLEEVVRILSDYDDADTKILASCCLEKAIPWLYKFDKGKQD
jgi:hypothetical protein